MEPSQFSPTSVGQISSYRRSTYIVLVAVVLIVLAVASYLVYGHYFSRTAVSVDTASVVPVTFGVVAGTGSTTGTPYGTMYYTSPAALYVQNNLVSFSHQFDLRGEESTLVTFRPSRDVNSIGTDEALLLVAEDDQYDSHTWKPYYMNRTTEEITALPRVEGHWINDLKFSPDRQHYAYAYTAERDPSPNLRSIADWHLAIHSMETGASTIIDAAVEPEWINDGTDLVYLTHEGIMSYNLATGQTTALFSDYVPFDFNDDLAVAPNSKHVVLTVPFLNGKTFVAVFEYADNTLKQVSRIVSDDTKRRSPVFSPDSQFYAVVAAPEKRVDGSDNVPETEKTIEIRAIDGLDPVRTITLAGTQAEPLELESWNQ